jgi:hypothetical protein
LFQIPAVLLGGLHRVGLPFQFGDVVLHACLLRLRKDPLEINGSGTDAYKILVRRQVHALDVEQLEARRRADP